MTASLHHESIVELSDKITTGEITSRQLVQVCLDRIEKFDARVNGFVSVLGDLALEQANRSDRRRAAGRPAGPLDGIPIGVKDSIPTAGIRTTSNSRVLENWIPRCDAEAIGRLRDAGAIVLGKTNLNEFGWSLPANTDLTPKALNPWNTTYAAIGSSSGSAVSVAAGFVAAAVGTDGGGSVRLPAGQHNLIGIKASHGTVSRRGMGESWVSEIAPMTRTVADAALMLSVMASGPRGSSPDLIARLDANISGWTLGVPRHLIDASGLEDEVSDAFEGSLDRLRSLGVNLVEVEPPGLAEARMANFVMLNGLAHAAHAVSLRTQREKYGQSARVYHWTGAFLSATDLLNARAVANRVRDLLQQAFGSVRALVMPTSPVVTAEAARNPDTHRKGANAVFTSPFNATGHPAISVPSGFSPTTGLPIGLQLVGPLGGERTLLQIAYALERLSDWQSVRADLARPDVASTSDPFARPD
ncbi:MAG: amidase [Pseudomonadota bacterium]